MRSYRPRSDGSVSSVLARVFRTASGPWALTGELRAILPAVAVGAALRCWNLRDQVLVGDELHTVRSALGSDLATVLTTYRESDPCLPLTALYRLMIEAAIPLSELALRLPVLLTGVLALVLLPLLLGRLAPRARVAFAWLLALSPALILYSRIVRPYAPIVLWSGLAASCFWIWWSASREGRAASATRQRGALAGFLVFAALAVWFHLGTAPFVASLFVFALVDILLAPPPARLGLLRNLLGAALALAAILAAILLPAADSLEEVVASKRVSQAIPLSTYLAVARIQAGTWFAAAAALFWAIALLGWGRLLRSAPRAAWFTAALVCGQLIGIRLLSPLALAAPIVFHRYLLPALPLVLLWFAVAISPPWLQRGGRVAGSTPADTSPRRQALLRASCLAGLVLAGPFTNPHARRTSFLHTDAYVDFSQPPPRADGEVAIRNRRLAEQPENGAVIAATWPASRDASRSFELAQQVHGRRVMVVAPGLAGQPAVAFRNFVAPDPQSLLASGAQFLTLHRDAAVEADTQSWPSELRRQFGPPAWREDSLQVWNLDTIRAGV